MAVFRAQDPAWTGDLDAWALTDCDRATSMEIDYDGICSRCYRKDEKRGPDEPYFFSAENQLDFGPVPTRLPELTPTEEALIARVHVHVNIMLVRGQQYKYRGHVVHFLREVGLVYNQLPLLPRELNTVLLRPANTSSHANLSRQFTRQFRVRRQAVMIWLDYLRHHHPGYRSIAIDDERLSQLPEDGNVVDAIPQSQVEAADVGPEEDQEAEHDLEDAAAVPDLLAKDTELDALRSILVDGRADFVEPRLRSIEYKDYIEHAMRWHDGRFARHPTFRFVAFNTLMRSQARARSKFFVKQHDGTREPLTREQLIQALEHAEDPRAQALINSITRKRQDLEAYAYSLGCPGAFITFSPADLHWRSLYQHMPRYEEWLGASEPERMALSRTKFNVTDYWGRYEWQGRGSPHNHGLYWMENGPVADMRDETARDLFARTWGFHITAINPEPNRTMPQGEGNPLSVDPLGVEMTFLRLSQIVNRCQRHRCNTAYCLRVRKRSGDLANDMQGAAADIEAANVADPERECRFNFPRALRELAAVIRKEGKSYYIFEAARNDSLMNHFNPAIILGWLANIDISPCTSLQAVITYAAKYCSKSEKKTEPYCKLADQVLPHTAHHQPLLSFSSRLMNKLIAERDYSAQEISHLLLNIPLQEGTRMVVYVDCRPLEQHVRSFRVDEDSYNLKTWRRLGANAKKRLMMAHPHRSPEELLAVDGQPFESFAAAYQCCRQRHHFHEDDHYGEVGANDLQAEDDEFQREEHEEPVVEEDWHELARMLPDHPLEEEDIDVLGRRDVDGDFWKQRKAENPFTLMWIISRWSCYSMWTAAVARANHTSSICFRRTSKPPRAEEDACLACRAHGRCGNQISGTTLHSLLHLPINKDFKPLSAIDKAQLQKKLKDVKYLIVDEKSMLGLRQLSWIDDRLREAFPNRNEEFFGGLNILLVGDFFQLPPVLQKPLYYDKEVQGVEIKGRNAYRRFDKTVFLKVAQRQRGNDQAAFRSALEELRLLQLSMESWKLLSSRVQAKLDDQEVAKFVNSLRVYATKDRVMAKNVGPGAAAAPDDKPVGLCNGARDPPCVIMMEFDKYRDFLVGATLCTRTQFPLIVCYAITVHKSQSITEDMIVTDLSCRDFQTGLSYVAVSRVKTLQGLMLDAPFDRNHLTYASPPEGIKMKMKDQQLRKRQVLTQNPYKIGDGST
ncbi:PIF1-like helicase [Hirsutella rhossiliensis]|uniref:ATP-dependent DNA helicase n=1 Tax=Hirsutella rhossiliensis TaxID=111463 RepID=A0A9P8SPF7_9HYPO|nr:PIF1-like helicase domain-containing protein [Hirsutella rhossiliensis]KAH0968885.1 PIF1-like helicase domain-containing protein [Hirsutella rhossiliensis]